MPTSIDQQLQERVEAFARDITALLKDAVAESVASALKGSGSRGGSVARASKKQVAPSRRADGKAVSPEKLLSTVKSSPGARMEELANALGTTTGSLKAPMQKLLDAKKVKRSGVARGTKYSAS